MASQENDYFFESVGDHTDSFSDTDTLPVDNKYKNSIYNNSKNEMLDRIEQTLIELRNEAEKQYNFTLLLTSGSSVASHLKQRKMLIDRRSVYVGNVDYSATPDQLEEHFRGCGSIKRVTILTDKFSGHPKGFAYIQFSDRVGMQTSLSMSNTLFLGRQIKVTEKRTNRPGISTTNRPPRGRGRARMIVKYIYPSRGDLKSRPRQYGFAPYYVLKRFKSKKFVNRTRFY